MASPVPQSSSAASKSGVSGMLPLTFYFRRRTGSSESSSDDCIPRPLCKRRPPAPAMNFKKKRPLGRPRKVPVAAKGTKLVDYSSSEDDCDQVSVSTSSGTAESLSKKDAPVKKKQLHKMYSRKQKSAVALYARHHGIRAAARHFGVHHKNVQRWRNEQVSKIRNPHKRANKKGQGRKISYPQDIEDKIVTWILEKRDVDCVAISTQLVQAKAQCLIKEHNPEFKASEGWARKFFRRNGLVLRTRTHISQNLPKDLEDKIKAFHQTVKDIRDSSDYPPEFICNMDETPLYLDTIPRKTVSRRGAKTVHVRTTCSEKNRITVTLCCTAAGKMLPPFTVFKGKTMRPLKNVTIPSGVYATTQTKAWMDEDRMLEWVRKVWCPYVQGKPALLALDTFSAHLTDKGTKLLVIPGGCTSVLQPLDISINKPFKGYVRQLWCQYMVDEAEKGVSIIKPVCKSVLLEWILKGVDLLESKPSIVKKSFDVAGIVLSGGDANVRDDESYSEIQELMKEVFGDEHMGYVSDHQSSESSNEEDPFASDDDAGAVDEVDSDKSSIRDPFASESDVNSATD